MVLKENERLDEVNDSIKLIQKTDGLTFGTDALLLAAFIDSNKSHGCELGGGTGIISMLLLTRQKLSASDCVEIQEEYSELIGRNADANNLSDKLNAICSDIRDYKPGITYDVVFTNPPYMKSSSGKRNSEDKKNMARHEVFGDINDFCVAAKRLTRYGGSFAVVYRPDRLADLLHAMKENLLEPKRITFVHADQNSEASIVLVEARRGGGVGILLTKPLFIYENSQHSNYTVDMEYINVHGRFPDNFYIKQRGQNGR